MYVFEKNGYDFVANDNETGNEYKVINDSKLKTTRNLFNWFVADTGFVYRTKWAGEEYIISPTFAGSGYAIRTKDGDYIGSAKELFFSKNMAVNTPDHNVRLKNNGVTEYTLVAKDTIIGSVKTSGVLKKYPILISLEPSIQQVAYLLVFFAILKEEAL
ncbi:hypothetical protein NBRC116493_13800 [Aurantivibrio infirmus]